MILVPEHRADDWYLPILKLQDQNSLGRAVAREKLSKMVGYEKLTEIPYFSNKLL